MTTDEQTTTTQRIGWEDGASITDFKGLDRL